MNSVELFAGAGGLGMGLSKAGFHHLAVIEWDGDACETIRSNQLFGHNLVGDWPIIQADVREYDFSSLAGRVDVISGGPPCQPFSLGGKHRGYLDPRDMFPQAIRAVRETAPRAFIFENVKGLTRTAFANYLEYIRLQLTHPCVVERRGEEWQDHLVRLERHHTHGKPGNLEYNLVSRIINAADYGVPQKRERFIIVGIRADLGMEWSFPSPTHSRRALMQDQWITGEYWERHKIATKGRPAGPSDCIGFRGVAKYTKPWRTIRDAIADLPDPEREFIKARQMANHLFQGGARSYTGHTGSPLDEPAKTLKAGDHGVPGGENMLVREDGSLRYFTVRESARLQTFPDDYLFSGSWTESMRQLGNAVPVMLAEAIASSVRDYLRGCGKPQPAHAI
jgi:DNA (cytosine-5)-methyltransferase 1